ncbi:MBOAT family O-acyltransferase [Janthinobacterium fluminis]|uniref:Probable alginate O-acetylase AlgI n=1 Tax=Janthinobacterium fluminis TaxID=2987524 RepID=A0ABT5K0U5_9BURK|nr:MBOAT family O-acyltransferase [Janthinobacterium fluminis]MDC8758295.1 MBOAT family protein [Janthinobacterium fluminis]
MLFNSYLFLLVFLPVALLGYYALGMAHRRLAACWLCLASLVFYGWWNPQYVALLLLSIAFNYLASQALLASAPWPRAQTALLTAAIAANLGLLFYYKYLAALFAFLADAGLVAHELDALILPLGISFFTFTQIGYLLDCKGGVVHERSALNYTLFVTFFPHLIAGPVLHHKEMMPQFADRATYRFQAENLSIGGALFAIGLAKKVLLADSVAHWAEAGFAEPDALRLWSAWGASLSYALQLYFDFSGYSDMALGLAKMFGVRFPLNFNSPYKAASIIDFWQRWHMTLTRYLNDYLYNPVAMALSRRRARRGLPVGRRAAASAAGFAQLVLLPTGFTMLLAGVWHGAGLQFLVFGLLHAGYLALNHAWRAFAGQRQQAPAGALRRAVRHAGGVALTLLAVLVGQAFFRADGVAGALSLLAGMSGQHGVEALPGWPWSGIEGGAALRSEDMLRLLVARWSETIQISLLFLIVWCMPNSQQIMGAFSPALKPASGAAPRWLQWRPSAGWLAVTLCMLAAALLSMHKETKFLYFQF